VLRAPEAPRCARVTVTAKLWLFDGAEPDRPQELLVRGQASDEKCPRALRAAVSKLVSELVARLDLRFSSRVVLFKDPTLPALEHGNAHAERGQWEKALEKYLHAVEAAKTRPEAEESLAHAIYSVSVALANLGRYEEALASLRKALKTRLDPRYVPLIEHYRLVKGETWAKPPPARPRRAKAGKARTGKGKRRRKVIHGMKRRVIWK
jgi:tetratricopeptide (TPR) repeat protein